MKGVWEVRESAQNSVPLFRTTRVFFSTEVTVYSVVLINWIMKKQTRVEDQKLKINLEWPYYNYMHHFIYLFIALYHSEFLFFTLCLYTFICILNYSWHGLPHQHITPKVERKKKESNEWMNVAQKPVHVYVQCFSLFFKPERTSWSLTPQLDTVVFGHFCFTSKREVPPAMLHCLSCPVCKPFNGSFT